MVFYAWGLAGNLTSSVVSCIVRYIDWLLEKVQLYFLLKNTVVVDGGKKKERGKWKEKNGALESELIRLLWMKYASSMQWGTQGNTETRRATLNKEGALVKTHTVRQTKKQDSLCAGSVCKLVPHYSSLTSFLVFHVPYPLRRIVREFDTRRKAVALKKWRTATSTESDSRNNRPGPLVFTPGGSGQTDPAPPTPLADAASATLAAFVNAPPTPRRPSLQEILSGVHR